MHLFVLFLERINPKEASLSLTQLRLSRVAEVEEEEEAEREMEEQQQVAPIKSKLL